MSGDCCDTSIDCSDSKFRNVLIIALALNFFMFIFEIVFGLLASSVSLKADALDFLGDSANYAASLFVVRSALHTKARVSMVKALTMFGFGVWIVVESLIRFYSDAIPNSFTMSWVGALALAVNLSVALLLYKFRDGDSNRQSVWLCSRNDAIGNVFVIAASFGVYYFQSKIPDLLVAFAIASLSLSSSSRVFLKAKEELKST